MRTRHLLLLLSALFVAGSASAAPRRAIVLLIPQDKGSYAPAARFTEYLETAVSKNPAYTLRETGSLLGDTTPAAAHEAKQKLGVAVAEAKKVFATGDFDEAERRFQKAIQDASAAAAAMEKCGDLCDAMAHLSSIALMKSDETAARDLGRQVLSIDKNFKFEGVAFGQNYQIILKEVRRDVGRTAILGSASVATTPPGARVYVNGVFKGYSPMSVERVPVGKHLLRLERAGYVTYGQFLDIGPAEDAVARAALSPTPEYAQLEAVLDKVAKDVEKGEPGAETLRLGSRFKVDRALVGTVRTGSDKVVLESILVDFAARRSLSKSDRTFQGDEYGQLEKEVQKFGNLLLAEGEVRRDPRAKKSNDPLDGRTGMEDWDEETGGDEDKPASPKKGSARKSED